jgi:hypothetical protein
MGRNYDLLRDNRRVRFPIDNVTKMREKPNEPAEIRLQATVLRAIRGGSTMMGFYGSPTERRRFIDFRLKCE